MNDRQLILDVVALRKSFGPLEVLKGVDLQVRPKELVFIIGPSGSGKSTLLRCCNRLEEPTSGAIRVEGIDIMAPGVDINMVRRRIGMVFQSFNLYPHLDALGNITLALRKVLKKPRAEAEEAGMRALARVGLADKARAYPNELSGGQQQRAAIARALALPRRNRVDPAPAVRGGALDRPQRGADHGLGDRAAGDAQRDPGPDQQHARSGEAHFDRERGGAARAALRGAPGAGAHLHNATPIIAAGIIYLVCLWPLVRLLSRFEHRQIALH